MDGSRLIGGSRTVGGRPGADLREGDGGVGVVQNDGDATNLLTERVYQALRSAIISCQLQPGESLQEGRLVRELGVSKTPVREGLVRLAETGLVTWTPYRGYAVSAGNLALPVTEQLSSVADLFSERTTMRSTGVPCSSGV